MKLEFMPRACPLFGATMVAATLDEAKLTASAFASRKLPEYMHSRMGFEELLALGFTNIVGVEPPTAPIAAAKPAIQRFAAYSRQINSNRRAWI